MDARGVRIIALIGLRGSGKTTLGRMLSERLGWEFIDLDDVTPGLLGCASVREAWERLGEAAFREGEARALREQLDTGGVSRVLALGGGTPTAPGASDALRAASADGVKTVYLRGTSETLRARLAGAENADRPSLTGAGVLEEIESVLGERDPLYLKLADCVVEIEGRSAAGLVGIIARMVIEG